MLLRAMVVEDNGDNDEDDENKRNVHVAQIEMCVVYSIAYTSQFCQSISSRSRVEDAKPRLNHALTPTLITPLFLELIPIYFKSNFSHIH